MKNTFLLTFFLFFSITKTFACTCVEINESLSKKVEKAFSESDLIISGKVIDKQVVNTKEVRSSADPIIYKLEIKKIIKGKLKKEVIEIVSEASGASCGYEFELGSSYLVYARESNYFSSKTTNELDFITSLCDRNQKLSNVNKRELKKLKKLGEKYDK